VPLLGVRDGGIKFAVVIAVVAAVLNLNNLDNWQFPGFH
jgi:hypothetical protein